MLPRYIVSIFSAGMMVLGAGAVSGQNFPNKPIRVVTAAVGGGSDFTTRLIAQGISSSLGQPVIVDNRAVGSVSAEIVSKAQPDGYSLLVNGAALWLQPILRNALYDVVRDFSPISLLVREVLVVAVHPSMQVKSVKELIDFAKAKPGVLNYSSGPIGSTGHLAAGLFKSMAGVNIVHVPYKGNATAITALVSGEVQLTISDAGLLAPHIKAGKVRALAVTSADPSVLNPGLPTVAATLPGYETVGVTGMFAPAGTPQAIINRLSQEIVRVLNLPDVKEKFFNAGAEVVGSTPEQLGAFVKADISKMAKVIKDAGIKGN